MVDILNVLDWILKIAGIMGFIVSSILGWLKFKQYLDERLPIDIDIYAMQGSFINLLDSERSGWYGNGSERLPNRVYQFDLNFGLTNKTSKPIGIKYLNVRWKNPKFETLKSENDYIFTFKTTQFLINTLIEPFELGNIQKMFHFKLQPSPFVSIELDKKLKELGKTKNKNEFKSLPFEFSIEVITSAGKKIIRNENFSINF